MKILHIEDYFLPHVGYQINILPKYQVEQGHDVWILTSKTEGIRKSNADFFGLENIEEKDKEYGKKTNVKIVRINPLTKRLLSSRVIQSPKFFKQIKEIDPDIIFCHGNDTLTGIRIALKYKKLKYPLVFDSHMLSMASNNSLNEYFYKFYKKTITPIIKKNKIKVIRTQNDNFVEEKLGIPLTQSPWISYGSDTLLFKPSIQEKQDFRKLNNISNEDFVIIYTGKLDEAKGGKLLAEAFEKRFNSKKNVVLIVVGNSQGIYGEEVEELFDKSENRILRFPTQQYLNLSKYYQAADLSVFPKQCSLSFYDAQACGLPVISENNNINIERVSFNNGFTFNSGDVEDFREKILLCINMDGYIFGKLKKSSHQYIIQNYNYIDVAEKYTKVLEKEIINFYN